MNPTTTPSRWLTLLSGALLLSLLPSCVIAHTSLNEPISPENVATLTPGMTSADVVKALGAPTDVVQLGLRSAYRFDHVKKKRTGLYVIIVGFFNEDTREDRVWAFFDEAGILTHIGSSFEADDTRYALPWNDLHE